MTENAMNENDPEREPARPAISEASRVSIRLMSADTSFSVDAMGQLADKLTKTDVGTGIVVGMKQEDIDGERRTIYRVAVIDGRFDPHRNDLGELWVNESEITPIDQSDPATLPKRIPGTKLVIGQRVCCKPLGEDGHIVGYEDEGFILIIDLVQGGTAHVPAADCTAR